MSWEALRIAGGVFYIPFMFAFRPSLLLLGTWPQFLWDVAIAGCALSAICAASIGYLRGELTKLQRMALYIISAFFIVTSMTFDLVGVGLLAAVVAWQFFRSPALAQ